MFVRVSRLLGVLAVVVAGLAFALPAAAAAKTYIVNETTDAADAAPDEVCDAVAGGTEQCTLRAAIEESNHSSGLVDLIGFDPSFNGELADTITLGAGLPPITDSAIINGSSCVTAVAAVSPCVGVAGPSNASVLTIDDADNVTINGLSVTGGQFGVDVIDSSAALTVTNDWIGVKLDGSAGGNSAAGIFVDPDSNGAAIGGPSLGQRNVISNNGDGVDILGADNAVISGNLFGVAPDGATKAANAKDIEITDSTAAPGFKATGNVVGGQLTEGQAASAECDGACNVISGASSFGIDLKGNGAPQEEAPASGKTQIQGNLIGLNSAGTGVIANFRVGVLVGEADEVQIGGSSAELANRINGGEAGVQAGPSAQDLTIEGNRIGLDATGTGSELAPTTEGIALNAEGATSGHEATIARNRIAMAGGDAIQAKNNGPTGTTIAENVIGRGVGDESLTAGSVGIHVIGFQGSGNGIERNIVENANVVGIFVQSSDNDLIGNEVIGTELGSGIVIQAFGPQESSGNIIGGDSAAEENVISGSGEDAIEIVDPFDTDNHILRNMGSGNADLFIDLGGDGPGNQPSGPNDGIQAPTIAAATPTSISGGGALPEATIRVFEKATAQNGEIKGFLGEVEADAGGNWKFEYASGLPDGTEIGVTQTGIEGTSELAQATSATPPPPPPPPGGGGGGGGSGASADTTPPQTRITKGPKAKSSSRLAKLRFSSTEQGSTFQCKLDRNPFRPCRSPKKFGGLKPGKHVFKVRATDAAGNTDPTPAVKKFTVLG